MSSSPTSEAVSDSAFVCDCGEWARYACVREPFYKDHEGKRYCVLHYPGEEKSADFKEAFQRKIENKDFNFRGVLFPDKVSFIKFEFDRDVDFSSAIFNAGLHFNFATFSARVYFHSATFREVASFNSAIFQKVASFSEATFGEKADFSFAAFIKGADFISTAFNKEAFFSDAAFGAEAGSGAQAYFSGFSVSANFRSATFGAKADFTFAKFEGADFGNTTFSAEAHFSRSIFDAKADVSAKADFISATFGSNAYFNDAAFRGEAYFVSATFIKRANFVSATFSLMAYFNDAAFSAKADFSFATFGERADFRSATFRDYFTLAGNKDSWVFIGRASLDLQFARIERPDLVSLHTLTLRPHWFVNVDARKFDFTNVDWDWRGINEGIEHLKRELPSSPHRLLTIACRNLAVNAEENHRYEEASRFRYIAMDLRRLEEEETPNITFWKRDWLHRLYWLLSGYGENIHRASWLLMGIWIAFSLAYLLTRHIHWHDFSNAFTYSLGVMTLQKPDPKPSGILTPALVTLETIIGPLQAALLALAIRRKFMR
ncbi:MAG: hypothetical protein WBP93_10855 [Pyrinomonadaceae bacterium]